jgi:hypothetical protein
VEPVAPAIPVLPVGPVGPDIWSSSRLALVRARVTISPSLCGAADWTPLYASEARVIVNVLPTTFVTVTISGLLPSVPLQIRQRKFGLGGVAPGTMSSVVWMSVMWWSRTQTMPFS